MPRHCEVFRPRKVFFNSKFSDHHLFDSSCVRSLLKLHNVVKPSVSFSDVVKCGTKAAAQSSVNNTVSSFVKPLKCVKKSVNVVHKPLCHTSVVKSREYRANPVKARPNNPVVTSVISLENKFTPLQEVSVMEDTAPIVGSERIASKNNTKKPSRSDDRNKVKADALGINTVLPLNSDDKYSLGLTSIAKKCDK